MYSQIPTSGAGDFTVTRATSATRVNASGLIESAKTNLVLRSEEFDNASIFKQRSSVSGNTIAAPDGNLTADTFSDITSVAGSHFIRLSDVSAVSGTTYAVSVFAKAGASNRIELSFRANNEGAIGFGETVFDLASGVIVNGTGSIIALSNNWYRCTSVGTVNASGTSNVFCYLYNSANQKSYTGTSGTNNVFIWGAQVEEGSSASEYIPTTTVARTRFAGVTVDGTSAINIPRLDYLASGGVIGCPALLVEPSGQNLAYHSSDWTSNWNGGSVSGTTVVTGSVISLAPDGTATANEIYPTSGNTNHLRLSNGTISVTFTSGTIYTQSAFFKAGVGIGTRIQLTFSFLRFTQEGYANFDLSAGTLLVLSGTTADTNRAARIENYGNGWYRCSLTATCNSAGNGTSNTATLINASGATRNPSFTGTVTDYVLGWGAQLETGSVATSYIPTTTAAVTRSADLISKTSASALIGQSEGTIYAEVDIRNVGLGEGSIVTLFQASNNYIEIIRGTSNRFIAAIADASGTTALATTTNFITANSVHKIALGYKSGEFALYVNGTQIATSSASRTIGGLTTVRLGSFSTSFIFNDRIRAAALYTTRLTNEQLQALTT